MKKFIAIYLSILCTFPILANGNVPCSTYSATNNNQNGNRTGCLTHGGCEWFSFDKICSPCSSDKYHPACSNPDSTDCQDTCSSCTDSSTGNWMAGAQTVLNSTFDTTNTQTGLESCPWVCEDGYFDDTEHTQCLFCPTNTSGFMSYPNGEAPTSDCANSCSGGKYIIDTLESANSTSHRYYCGECGLGTQSSNGAVSTCTCYNAPGVNRVYGGGPNRTTNRIECECPNEAEWNSSTQQCECSNNKVLAQNTDGEWYCADCPTNSTKRNNVCKCKPGYYGADNSPCTQCPTGMTTITNDNGYGATDSSACYMTGNTEFCINGATTSCLKFIPSGIKINVNGEVSAN